jgi:hypothetical protein
MKDKGEGLFQYFERRIRELGAPPAVEGRIRELVNAPTSLVEMLRWRADEIEQHRPLLGPPIVTLLREAAAALERSTSSSLRQPEWFGLAEKPSPNTARSLTSASLVRCTTCNTMTHIPTGTVCALCLANVAAAFEVRSGLQAQRLAEREPGCTGDDSCPLHHHGTLFERSTTPMFSSKVPEPGDSGALTREHLKGFADMLVVAKRYLDGPLNAEPMCEHGVRVVTCYECSRSRLRKLPKHERPQSGGSCDCPARDGALCTASEIDCRVRAYHNGRLTVRSWFRKMRAAEFERDLPGRERVPLVRSQASMYEPWTLFDTQKVVNRETAANYVRFPDDWTGSERAAWRRLFEPFYDGTR